MPPIIPRGQSRALLGCPPHAEFNAPLYVLALPPAADGRQIMRCGHCDRRFCPCGGRVKMSPERSNHITRKPEIPALSSLS